MAVATVGPTLTPLDEEFFYTANADALDAIAAIDRAMIAEMQGRSVLANCRASIAVIEARIALSIEGNNAETRKYKLLIALRESEEYNDAHLELYECERRLLAAQRDLERLRELRSIAKRRMEFAVASRNFHAAIGLD